MSLAFFEEFDELPDATDEFDRAEEQDFATGAWMWLHHLLNQLGYQANDGEEEIDLLFEDIRSRLYAIAAGVATARAERKVDELVTELEALPAAMRQSLGEGGEHEHRYATREQLDDE